MKTEISDRPEGSLDCDPDVTLVINFMQARIAASRLVSVADGLAALAPILWGGYRPERVTVLRLSEPPLIASGLRKPTTSNE